MGTTGKTKRKKRIHTHRDFWISKIKENMVRDRKQEKELDDMGWKVIRFWERHEVLKDLDACAEKVIQNIKE